MSNEYKDWLWDTIQEIVFDRGLVDKITDIYPIPDEGEPCYIEGLKNLQRVKYYIHYLPEEGWLCEHRELDHFD